MADTPSFGASLRAARDAAGLTQAKLADKLGVDSITISRWENGVTPNRWLMPKLLRALPTLAAPPEDT